jgi:hypothetical protein
MITSLAVANPTKEQASMADQNKDANHSLDRRREERALNDLAQDSVTRFTDLTAVGMEVMQKNIEWQSEIARYWADSLNVAQNSMNQIISTVQQQQRKAS